VKPVILGPFDEPTLRPVTEAYGVQPMIGVKEQIRRAIS